MEDALVSVFLGPTLSGELLEVLPVDQIDFQDTQFGGNALGKYQVRIPFEAATNLLAGNRVDCYLRQDQLTEGVASGTNALAVANPQRFCTYSPSLSAWNPDAGLQVALFDGVNFDFGEIESVDVQNGLVYLQNNVAHTYGAGISVLVLRHRGMISQRTRDANLSNITLIETQGYQILLNAAIVDIDLENVECGYAIYNLLLSFQNQLHLNVDPVNFVMSPNGQYVSGGTEVPYTSQTRSAVLGQVLNDIVQTANANANNTVYTIYIDPLNNVYFRVLPQTIAQAEQAGSYVQVDLVNAYPAFSDDFIYNSLDQHQDIDQDTSGLFNSLRITGGKDSKGNTIQVIVEDSLSQSIYGLYETTLTNSQFTDPESLAAWGEGQLAVLAFPRETTNTNFNTTGSFANAQALIQITGYNTAANPYFIVPDPFNVQSVETQWQAGWGSFQQRITGVQLVPDTSSLIRQISEEHYIANSGLADSGTDIYDRYVQWGCGASLVGNTFEMNPGAVCALVSPTLSGAITLDTFPVSSFSYTPPLSGVTQINTLAYRYDDANQVVLSNPGLVWFTGTIPPSGIGYTAQQIIPLWAVSQMNGQICGVTDLRHFGGIGIGNLPGQNNAAPIILTNSSSVSAFASLTGSLQDFEVQTTVTNVPTDGSVGRVAWAIRKTQDAYIPIPNATPIIIGVPQSFATRGYINCAFNPGDILPGDLAFFAYQLNGTPPTVSAGWTASDVSGGQVAGFVYKIWTESDLSAQSVLSVGYNNALAYTQYVIRNVNPSHPIDVINETQNTDLSYVSLPAVKPIELSEFGIITVGSPDTLSTAPGDFTADSDYVNQGYAATNVYGSLVYETSFYAETVTESLTATIQPNIAIPSSNWGSGINTYAAMALIRAKYPSGLIGGTVYPWTIYAETNLPEANVAEQALEFAYGQVTTGISYDFGLAYVNVGGFLVSPITEFINNYTSPLTLGIPNQYLLKGVTYTPMASAGIQANTGTPTYTESVSAVIEGFTENGMTTTWQFSFQFLNQPQDGSLVGVGIWYRVLGSNPWSFYCEVPAVGIGDSLANFPIRGNYEIVLADLSNGQAYDFGMSGIGINNEQTEPIYVASTPSNPLTPPGLNNGSVNLVVDSGFAACAWEPGNSGSGFKSNTVSSTNPYWYPFGLDGVNIVWSQPGNAGEAGDLGNYIAGDTAAGNTTFGAISSPITVAPGQVYTLSANLNTMGDSGNNPFVAIVDSTKSNTYTQIYAQAAQSTGTNGRVSFTWTNPVTANIQTIAVMLNSDGDHVGSPAYLYMAKPMLQVGSTLSGYVDGPASPSTGTIVKSLGVGTGNASDAASIPQLTSGTTLPLSGAPASLFLKTNGATGANVFAAGLDSVYRAIGGDSSPSISSFSGYTEIFTDDTLDTIVTDGTLNTILLPTLFYGEIT